MKGLLDISLVLDNTGSIFWSFGGEGGEVEETPFRRISITFFKRNVL